MRAMRITILIILAVVLASFGCQRDTGESSNLGKATGSGSATTTQAAGTDLDSKDILARTTTAPAVQVKHVLIGWKDLAAAYRGQMDPRAAGRTEAEAAKLAREVAAQLRTKPAMLDELVEKHSEDPGSKGGVPYDVKADTPFVPEFKNLALRLRENEVGIVKTSYGYHVMMRLPPPPPDPLESADMLARQLSEKPTSAHVQHVLVSWKDAPGARDPRAQARTKADADKLATELLAKVRAGGDMAALMKEHSEDPGSKDNARVYEVTPDAPMVEPFKNLSLRLHDGEAGLVKSPFGWHVIKRVPPPPPDSLESTAILAREPAAAKTKVKHILLGWTDSHTEDPRGTKRTRGELEKLVKTTVAQLQKGAKIEPLMAQLSEDPGSAKSGEGYDATPDASLVPPFKKLALRLKVGEVGVVKTDFGMHIIKRVE